MCLQRQYNRGMNSKERDLLNATHKHGTVGAAGLALGLKRSTIYYYQVKWERRGWYDGEELTEEAPPFEPTLRQQMLETLGMG